MIYRQNLLLGGLLIVASELFFATMGAAVKEVSLLGMSNEMTVFMRNLIGLVFLLPLVLRSPARLLQTKVFHLHLLRGLAGILAMYCFFYALSHLALANGMLLKMTSPLFMPLIAMAWLGEELRAQTLVAVALGFGGVILVLDPASGWDPVALAGLAGGGLAALAKSTVRRLGHTEPNLRVVFYFALIGLVVSGFPLAWAWQTPSLQQSFWLLAIGLFGTLGQMLLTRGYAIAPSGQVSPFTYFSVIFGSFYGYLFWQEIPSHGFWLGAVLVAVAGVLTLRAKERPAGID